MEQNKTSHCIQIHRAATNRFRACGREETMEKNIAYETKQGSHCIQDNSACCAAPGRLARPRARNQKKQKYSVWILMDYVWILLDSVWVRIDAVGMLVDSGGL